MNYRVKVYKSLLHAHGRGTTTGRKRLSDHVVEDLRPKTLGRDEIWSSTEINLQNIPVVPKFSEIYDAFTFGHTGLRPKFRLLGAVQVRLYFLRHGGTDVDSMHI